MAGLSRKDLTILGEYADQGNRELYWNYLAQKDGADGYGLLALGVVRNDNLPGQVANAYAQSQARTQNERDPAFTSRTLTEREWDEFGQTLLKRDLQLRADWLDTGNAELALNLPGRDVQLAHDQAFKAHNLDPNCWTPRILLEATRKKDGEHAAEAVWKDMLNNEARGTRRALDTTGNAFAAMPWAQASMYVAKLGAYELAMAKEAMPTNDPNVIGMQSSHHVYSEREGAWHIQVEGAPPIRERNASMIDRLNDTRELRLEQQERATQFHPDDNYRTLIDSPKVVSNDLPGPRGETATRLAMGPGHADYPLYQQVRGHVTALDAKLGREFDETSERMTLSLVALAKENGLERADHVVLSDATGASAAGQRVFVVQGDLNDPAHLRASMATDVAVQAPVEQSLRQLASFGQEQQLQTAAQSQQAEQDAVARESQSQAMRMG
ncbi:XVIPCD domain-containing protein [Stenotrophomonas lacuserhaii]|uniref:XVIPCD domain-containing protein n=1 Tax=Stenotrophomonas lacuserhaii TaxID=2760084 RepID=UPI0032EEEEF7